MGLRSTHSISAESAQMPVVRSSVCVCVCDLIGREWASTIPRISIANWREGSSDLWFFSLLERVAFTSWIFQTASRRLKRMNRATG